MKEKKIERSVRVYPSNYERLKQIASSENLSMGDLLEKMTAVYQKEVNSRCI